MSERIDQFCENLRIKLTSIDNNIRALKAKIDSKAQTVNRLPNLTHHWSAPVRVDKVGDLRIG